MFVNDLPYNILYYICKYLPFIDILNLSKTCKKFYILIEKENYFWMTLIQNHFAPKLYQHYVNEIFHNEKNCDYVLYRSDKDKEKFEKRFRKYPKNDPCNFYLLNVLNGKNNINGFLAYKSIINQKLSPRTDQLKMSLTIEEFFQYYVNTNKYLTKENILQISL